MGRVVYARSTDPDERLGEDLLLRGKISVRQYLEASKLIAPGRRLGTILVELGALEPEDLIGAIEHHVKQILLDVFTWTRGEYELVMTEPGRERRDRAQLLDRGPDPRGHPAHARLEPRLARRRRRPRVDPGADRQHRGRCCASS